MPAGQKQPPTGSKQKLRTTGIQKRKVSVKREHPHIQSNHDFVSYDVVSQTTKNAHDPSSLNIKINQGPAHPQLLGAKPSTTQHSQALKMKSQQISQR